MYSISSFTSTFLYKSVFSSTKNDINPINMINPVLNTINNLINCYIYIGHLVY